ncbi:MAG: hypothetical protein LWX02_06210 [Deltaproteobacteria bacterium]|nr:hypothetical protein [Deltaproteobacteria bacterium]
MSGRSSQNCWVYQRAIEVISPVETRRFEFTMQGRMAAGKPIEAVEDVDVIEVLSFLVGSGEHFVLQIKVDSI